MNYGIGNHGHVCMTCPAYEYGNLMCMLDAFIAQGNLVVRKWNGMDTSVISVGEMERVRKGMSYFVSCSEQDAERPHARIGMTMSLYPSEFAVLQFLSGYMSAGGLPGAGWPKESAEHYWQAAAERNRVYWQDRRGRSR